MSGGHWDYEDLRIPEYMEKIANDRYVLKRFPALAAIFLALGETIGDITHDLDWDFSGDTSIGNDDEFEREAVKKIGECLKLKLKIKVYEVNP